MPEQWTVLVIDDDPVDAELLRRYLDEIPDHEVELLAFTKIEEGLEALLSRADIDIIFIDYLLGERTGLDALDAINRADVQKPVIMLTGQGSEVVAVEAMKAGASDYLIKGRIQPEALRRAIGNALDKAALHQKIEEQRLELERLARTDGLTGLYNRRFLMERMAGEMAACDERGVPFVVLMIDLDHFKKVNDTYGHIAGDEALVRAAGALADVIGPRGIAGRYGGEEFCAILSDITLPEASDLAERLRARVAEIEINAPGGEIFGITCSIGIAENAPKNRDIKALLHDADEALYQAKTGGRNQVVCV